MKLDKFHYHEALHTANSMCKFIDISLVQHPVWESAPKDVKDYVVKAQEQLRHYSTTENLFVEDADGMEEYNILWRNRSHETPWQIKTVSREFGAGILDYINYFNEKLK